MDVRFGSRVKAHDLHPVAALDAIVPPPEDTGASDRADEAVVGDRDAVRVAAEIGQHGSGSAKAWIALRDRCVRNCGRGSEPVLDRAPLAQIQLGVGQFPFSLLFRMMGVLGRLRRSFQSPDVDASNVLARVPFGRSAQL